MPEIIYSQTFEKGFNKIRLKKDRQLVFDKLEAFRNDQENADIKKLKPSSENKFRLRAGNFRVIFEFESANVVKLLKIDKRDSVY